MNMGNNFLERYETEHPWAFGAFAELLQNSNDAEASRSDILYKVRKGADYLEFSDNGKGMSSAAIQHCFTLGDSRPGRTDDDHISGQFGVGFKQGTLRLGHTAVVISRSTEEKNISFGLLSNQPFTENRHEPVWAYTTLDLDGNDVSGNINREGIMETKKSVIEKIKQVVKNLDDADSFFTLELGKRIGGSVGTTVLIFGLQERIKQYEEVQKMEVDTATHDIRLTVRIDGDQIRSPFQREESNERWQGVDIPMESSLREYCKILFLRPRMEIWLLEKKVLSICLLNEMKLVQKQGLRAGDGLDAPIVVRIGRHEWHREKRLCGIFI